MENNELSKRQSQQTKKENGKCMRIAQEWVFDNDFNNWTDLCNGWMESKKKSNSFRRILVHKYNI